MALSKIVKAGSITNLTDARFFAAYEVAFLGFCFNPLSTNYISPAQATQIRSWVTGPQIVAEFDNQDIENALNIIDFFKPDLLEFESTFFLENHLKICALNLPIILTSILPLEENNLYKKVEFNLLPYSSSCLTMERYAKNYMFHFNNHYEPILQLHMHAIQVNGSIEKAVGLKQFDSLASILDLLVIVE